MWKIRQTGEVCGLVTDRRDFSICLKQNQKVVESRDKSFQGAIQEEGRVRGRQRRREIHGVADRSRNGNPFLRPPFRRSEGLARIEDSGDLWSTGKQISGKPSLVDTRGNVFIRISISCSASKNQEYLWIKGSIDSNKKFYFSSENNKRFSN